MQRLQEFLAEAKRRRVHSTLAAYAGISFVLWQATEVFVPSLNLPDWVSTAVVAGTLLGFPVAAVLSWVFVITLTPHRTDERVPASGIVWGLREIHERSLWQTGVGYLVASWMTLQVTETLSSLIGLPLWMGRAVLSVLLLGAPGVLGAAWVQSRSGQSSATGLSGLFSWRNALLGSAGAFLLLGLGTGGYLGMRSAGIGPAGSLLAQDVFQESERLLLAEFTSSASNPSLATMATEILRVDLAQSASIALVPPTIIAEALTRMELPPDAALTEDVSAELAVREGIKAVILGDVSEVGGRYVLSLRLVAAEDRAILSAHRETVGEPDFIEGVDRLSAKLRERIGESLRSIRGNPPLERVTTASFQALEKYALAERANNRGERDRALSLLHEAVSADSLFAMAHRKIGVVLSNAGRDADVAQVAFQKAYDLRDRLTERERQIAVGSYHWWVWRDHAAAIQAYRTLLEQYPTDRTGLHNLAVIYLSGGRSEEALAVYQRSMDFGVAIPATYQGAVELQFRTGGVEDARATLGRFADAYPAHPTLPRIESALASAQFDFDRAERFAADARATPTEALVVAASLDFELGRLALVQGRLSEWLSHSSRGYEAMTRENMLIGFPPGSLDFAATRVAVDLWAGADPDRIAADLQRLLEDEGYFQLDDANRDDLLIASSFARVGRPDLARDLTASHEARLGLPEDDSSSRSPGMWGVYAEISLAEGRYDDAAGEFREARTASPGCELCYLFDLGRAQAAAGRVDEATSSFEAYLARPYLYRLQYDASSLWAVLYGLGELHEQIGNRQEAITYYQRFVDLWQDADPELQPRVREARDAIARLTAS